VWLGATEGLVAASLLACFICNRLLPHASLRFLSEVAQLSPQWMGLIGLKVQRWRYPVFHRMTVAIVRWTAVPSRPSENALVDSMMSASPPAAHPSPLSSGKISAKFDFHAVPSPSTMPISSYSRSGNAELKISILQCLSFDGYTAPWVGTNVAVTHPPATTIIATQDTTLGVLFMS
jgi:hypothetical protein